jgi:hypothetical protein
MSDADEDITIHEDGGENQLAALETRLKRNMFAAVAAAVAGSLLVAPWRVTTGLFLGGALAFFNYHWLHTALSAIMGRAANPEAVITASPSRYVWRYFIIAGVVGFAVTLNLVSLPATLAGLLAFAVAIMFEGLAQIYFSIAKEEI